MFPGEVEKQLEGRMLPEVGLGLFQHVAIDSVEVLLDKTMLLVLLELQAETQLCCHSSSPRNEGRDSEAISHAKLACLTDQAWLSSLQAACVRMPSLFLRSVDSPDDRQKRLLETMVSKDIDTF